MSKVQTANTLSDIWSTPYSVAQQPARIPGISGAWLPFIPSALAVVATGVGIGIAARK